MNTNPGSIVNTVPSGIDPVSPTPSLTPEQPIDSGGDISSNRDGYDTGHPLQDWWHRVTDGFKDFFGIAGSQTGTSGHSLIDSGGSFDPITGHVVDNISDGYIKDIVTDPVTGEQTFVDHDKNLDDIMAGVLGGSGSSSGSSAKESSTVNSYLDLYKQTGNVAYLEKYLDDLIARENVQSARDYEKMMSDTSFSRLIADIEKSGYNPWLALQGSSVSQASSGSAVAAGQSGVNAAQISATAQNNLTSNIFGLVGNIIRAFAMIYGHSDKSYNYDNAQQTFNIYK